MLKAIFLIFKQSHASSCSYNICFKTVIRKFVNLDHVCMKKIVQLSRSPRFAMLTKLCRSLPLNIELTLNFVLLDVQIAQGFNRESFDNNYISYIMRS